MTKINSIARRDFLRLASIVPFALTWSCSGKSSTSGDIEAALKTLILAIGPWKEDKRDQAVSFANRFLAAPTVSEPFFALGESAKSLVSRAPFDSQPMAMDSLDFSACNKSERELLTSLTSKLYGSLEMHYFHVAGMPDAGICAGREWYKLPPSEW